MVAAASKVEHSVAREVAQVALEGEEPAGYPGASLEALVAVVGLGARRFLVQGRGTAKSPSDLSWMKLRSPQQARGRAPLLELLKALLNRYVSQAQRKKPLRPRSSSRRTARAEAHRRQVRQGQ